MKINELEMIDMLNFMFESGLIEREKWERISAVFWIRGIDVLFRKDNKYEKCVKSGGNIGDEYRHLYSQYSVTLLVDDISEAPIWKTLGIERGLIYYLSELFVWSVTNLSGPNFGYGFGGIEKMKQSRLPEV